MKLSRRISLVLTMASIAIVSSLPQNPTTSRAVIGETIQHITKQLMELNSTSGMTFDTRTPPRIKQHHKLLMSDKSHPGVAEPIDDEGLLLEEANKRLDEKNKNYYKHESPTTDSGLSTWILLSQRESSTTQKPATTKKPVVKDVPKNNTVIVDDNNKIIKPIFKRRTTLSTTKKPVTSASTTIKAIVTTTAPEKTTKLMKIKASVLNNALSNKNTTSNNKNTTQFGYKKPTTAKLVASTIASVTKPTKVTKKSTTTEANIKIPTTTKFVKIEMQTSNITNEVIESNAILSPEAKDGELDLSNTTKKTKRPVTTTATKKKKNKNRRKKPTIADDRIDATNNTKLVLNNKIKGKPIGTQIYNYLSREVMPTVGVGLVGLMVTAGLASYFLYPFGPVRRSYDIDRKDKEGVYYYKDEYSGGIAEEDAIGKVIAGMPQNNYNYNVRAQNSRNTYNSNRYRQVDPVQRFQSSVETVQLNPNTNYHTQMVQTQTEDVVMGSPKQDYKDTNGIERNQADADRQFVVGSVPKELQIEMESATPAVVPEHGPRAIESFTQPPNDENVFIVQSVPGDNVKNEHDPRKTRIEHGPRSLKLIRRRRNAEESSVSINEIENEIQIDDSRLQYKESDSTTQTDFSTTTQANYETTRNIDTTKLLDTTTTQTTEYFSYDTTSTTVNPFLEKTESIIHLIKDLFYYKIRLGLELFANKTEALSRYFRKAQDRIDVTYKNIRKNYRHE